MYPDNKGIQPAGIFYFPPHPVMQYPQWLIKGAHPHADTTISAATGKEAKTLLSIDRPPQQSFPVTYVVYLIGWLSSHNSLSRTKSGALVTLHTELPDPELDRTIG